MKSLLLIPLLLFTLGCEPNEMSQAESEAAQACIEKGWLATVMISGSHRDFKCNPIK